MRTLVAIVLAGAYFGSGLVTLGPTARNLQASCQVGLQPMQKAVAVLVWPVSYGATLNMESEC